MPISKYQSSKAKMVVFFGAPDPSLLFILGNLQKPPFPWWAAKWMTGVSFPATQRAVEAVLVSVLVIQPFHISFFHLSCVHPYEQQHSSQVSGCWWTVLKIPFADSTENVSEEFNFRRRICSYIIKILFLTLEVRALPTILCSPQSHPL